MDTMRCVRWGFVFALGSPCAMLAAPTVGAADEVRAAGTGSGSVLMQRLADAYQRRDPAARVTVLMPPLGSAGSLRAISSGRAHIAMIARVLAADESRGMEVREIARTAIVLASSDGERKDGLSSQDLADAMRGRITKWDDGRPIRLVLRNPRESDYVVLRTLSEEVASAIDAAGTRPGMVYAENDLDAIDLLARTPGSLGTTTLGMITMTGQPLQVIPLNGVAPTLEALAAGRYPLAKRLFVVLSSTSGPAARRFAEFMTSDAGREVLRQAGHLPVGPP